MKKAIQCIFLLCFIASFIPVLACRAASSDYLGVTEGEILTYKVSIQASSFSNSFEFTLTIGSITENGNTSSVTFTMTGNSDAAKYGFLGGSSQYQVNNTPSNPSPSQYIINKNTIYKNFSGSYGGFQAKANWDDQGVLATLLMDGGNNLYTYSIILEGRFVLQMWTITFSLLAIIGFSIFFGLMMKKQPIEDIRQDLERLVQNASETGGKINLKALCKYLQKSSLLVEMMITELLGMGKITGRFEGQNFILQDPSPEAISAIITRLMA